MCYIYGSVQVTTSVCPMCKVFKPSGSRCPHKHDVCKNSALHPRHDVVHMRNAEVQTFNGCGYCKWARTNPPPKQAGSANPGWPGCCRKPEPGESRLIPPADWIAVATVHHIPVPPEVKALLESINSVTSKSGSSFGNSSPLGKSTLASIPPPSLDRRSSSGAVPSRSSSAPYAPRTQPLAIPIKSRSAGSPKEPVVSLTSATTRTPLRDSPPTSNSALVDFGPTHHRKTSVDNAEKRGDSPNTPSPLRRSLELERAESSRGAPRRSSVSKATSASLKSLVDPSPVIRRRASITESPSLTGPQLASIGRLERRETISAGRPNTKKSSLDIDFSVLSISTGSSKSPISAHSDSSDSSSQSGSSEGTITSDGAFTDYLSDESDAELQKQAEAKAALLAQTHAEEQEFRAARQQLASVGLRPPKSWGTGNGSSQMTPRAQGTDQVYGVLSTSSYTANTRGQVDAVGVGRAR
ncbi:hypothetical protein EDB92DRAFT_1871326 [Lactarius akahatsu]|uniref:Uncharacterized protein n=1 Tax=Lactarius akahatsu TaxID=416441 RepID=A0AAD4LGJ6_9AGAM|nr:hypothetical protein EDB92DRAFT_1871326 [Lactarius akahatsu]